VTLFKVIVAFYKPQSVITSQLKYKPTRLQTYSENVSSELIRE